MENILSLPARSGAARYNSTPKAGRRVVHRQLGENARNAGSAATGNLVNAAITTCLFVVTIPRQYIVVFWLLLVGLIG